MLIDYHTHHERCGHAKGTLREVIEAAIEKGIKQLGISDHSPLYFKEGDHPNPGATMSKSEFPRYVNEMLSLREEYKDRIDIRLGVESDYIAGWESEYENIYKEYPFDFIIGSVHYFDNLHVFDRTRWEQPDVDFYEVFVRYFELVRMAAKSGLFDILGHIDAVKGLGHAPEQSLAREWDLTAQAISESGCAVELNTSGIRKCGDIFPAYPLLERLHRLNVPFTYGSDAHDPDTLGDHWDEVRMALKQLGVREIATFKNRQRRMIPLE